MNALKQCSRCKESKPTDCFGVHRSKPDGLATWCRDCKKAHSKATRAVYRKARLETQRKWQAANREKLIEYDRKYAKKHPDKYKARQILKQEIKMGRIERKPCEVCGEVKVDGHHDDYTKPLEVRWLCRAHHTEAHIKP
jgi:hypothetical protein